MQPCQRLGSTMSWSARLGGQYKPYDRAISEAGAAKLLEHANKPKMSPRGRARRALLLVCSGASRGASGTAAVGGSGLRRLGAILL